MKRGSIFSLKRFGSILVYDSFSFAPQFLWAMGGAFSFISVVAVFKAMMGTVTGEGFLPGWFGPLLFLGGLIFTSISFREMKSPQQRMEYLLVPVSPFEKYLSRLVLSGVGFVVLTAVLMALYSVMLLALSMLMVKAPSPIFNPLSHTVLIQAKTYLTIHAAFFLGAIYFRKNAFLKTVFTIFVVGIGMAIISMILGQMVFRDFLQMHLQYSTQDGLIFSGNPFEGIAIWGNILKYLLTFCLPLWLLVIAFVRFRESEV